MNKRKESKFIGISFLLHIAFFIFFMVTYGGNAARVGVDGGISVTLSTNLPVEKERRSSLPNKYPPELSEKKGPSPKKDISKLSGKDGAIQSDISISGDTSANLGAGIIKYYKPSYPILSRVRGEEGRVRLAATIKEDGFVDSVRLEESSGYERLDKAAIKALYKFRFAPFPFKDGIMLEEKRVSFRFALKE